MKQAIKFFIIFNTFFISYVNACSIKESQKIGLYSGAMTSLLKELGLAASKNISFHSSYFPIGNKFSKELKGGLFAAKKNFENLSADVIFYDDSSDLRKLFESVGYKNMIAIKTAGLTPFEVSELTIKYLRPLLIDCEDKIQSISEMKNKLKLKKLSLEKVLFFIGEIKEEKLPQLIMVNDGFVKYLKNNEAIKTYDTELAYVTWSERIIKKYKDEGYLFIGLINNENSFKVQKINDTIYNIYCSGCLLPGLSQISFLQQLIDYKF